MRQDSRENDKRARARVELTDPSGERPRSWLTSVLILFAVLSVVLLYWKRPRDEEDLARSPATVTSRDREPQHRGLSPATQQQPEKAKDPRQPAEPLTKPEATKPSGVDRFWELNPKVRSTYLADADQETIASTLSAVSTQEKESVLQALREIVADPNDPARQPALQALLNWPILPAETLAEVFAVALEDEDPSLGIFAAGLLTSRNDPTASQVLSKVFAAGDEHVRLTIVQFLDPDNAAASLLHQAAGDPNAEVRSFATRTLTPPVAEPSQVEP